MMILSSSSVTTYLLKLCSLKCKSY